MAEIDLGPVEGPKGTSMRFRGDWNGIAEYRNDEMFVDCVAYDNGLWICKATCSAQMPADGSEYWSFACAGIAGPQGEKGDKGDKGDTPDLRDMGINASAQEINQLTGVAGNVQEQIASAQSKLDVLSGNLEIAEVSAAYTLANSSTGSIVAYKMGSLVFLSGDITLPSTYTTDSTFLFATTTTLRPKKNEFISAMRGTSGVTGTACRVQIGSNGYLQAYCPAGSSWSMRFSAVYIV